MAGTRFENAAGHLFWMNLFMLSIDAQLELVRGLHPVYDFSLMHLFFSAMGGILGVFMYQVQLTEKRRWLSRAC